MLFETTCVALLFGAPPSALVGVLRDTSDSQQLADEFIREMVERSQGQLPWVEALGFLLNGFKKVRTGQSLPGGFMQETRGLQKSLQNKHEFVDITPFACQQGLHITGTTVVQVVVVLKNNTKSTIRKEGNEQGATGEEDELGTKDWIGGGKDEEADEEYWTRTFDAVNPKICEAFLLKPLLSTRHSSL